MLNTPQLSVAVAGKRVMVAPQIPGSLSTISAPGQVIIGFSLSITVTFCVQVCVLPATSVTVQVTVVTPTGYRLLAGALLVITSGPGQLSPVCIGGVNVTVA